MWYERRPFEPLKRTTSGSHLNAREVVVVGDGRNAKNNHLRLAFKREGGGGAGRRSKRRKEPPPAHI